jgi:hypothetical protein
MKSIILSSFAEGSNNFFSWIIFYQFFISGTMIGLTLFHLTIVSSCSLTYTVTNISLRLLL